MRMLVYGFLVYRFRLRRFIMRICIIFIKSSSQIRVSYSKVGSLRDIWKTRRKLQLRNIRLTFHSQVVTLVNPSAIIILEEVVLFFLLLEILVVDQL